MSENEKNNDVEIAVGGMFRPSNPHPGLDLTVDKYAAGWDESKHPRGQPENAGQFGSGGGHAKPQEESHENRYKRLTAAGHRVDDMKDDPSTLKAYDEATKGNQPETEEEKHKRLAEKKKDIEHERDHGTMRPRDPLVEAQHRQETEEMGGRSPDDLPKFARGAHWAAINSRGAIMESEQANQAGTWQAHRKAASAHAAAAQHQREAMSDEGTAFHDQESAKHKEQAESLYNSRSGASTGKPRPKIETQNEGYGFAGTVYNFDLGENALADAQKQFNDAAWKLVDHYGMTPDQARDFLDSKAGRHIADQMKEAGGDVLKAVELCYGGTSPHGAARAKKAIEQFKSSGG